MNYISENRFLSLEEMKVNAEIIYDYFILRTWTPNAICAMLGNMQTESTINPGIWESLTDNPESYLNEHGRYPGYGLVQWTPFTKYTDWCKSQVPILAYGDIISQLKRIEYEITNGLQWISTSEYPLSFKEFVVSKETPEYLAQAFLKNYERPADQNQPARSTQARYWYNLLYGSTPEPGGTTKKKKQNYKFVLFRRKTRVF